MDLAICGALAVLELATIRPVREADQLSTFSKLTIAFLLQYAAMKLYRIVLYPAFFSPLRHVPGPQDNHPFLGQELNRYRAAGPASLELSWMRRWPSAPFIRVLSIGGQETLLVNSLDAHRAFVQTHAYDFVKPTFFARIVRDIAGAGLLFAEGDEHRRQRRLLLGPFSAPSMRKLTPVFQEEARTLSDVFEEAIGEKPCGSIEVDHAFSEAFMDVIGRTVLGLRLETLSSTHPLGFRELYSRMLHQGPVGSLIGLVNAFVPVRRFLPLEANRRFLRAKRDLDVMLRGIIERRAAALADGTFRRETGESRDILTYMLEEAEVHRKQTGEEVWTVEDIVGHLLNFTSAGHETTSTALVWSVYIMATRHDIQDAVRAEIQQLLSTSPSPTHDEIAGLPYLHDFLQETLRLYSPGNVSISPPSTQSSLSTHTPPPLPKIPGLLVSRQTTRPLLISGVSIPRGTRVELRGPTIHQNPDVWGADAGSFDPSRWGDDRRRPASPYALEAFLQGPRMCPGRHFALAGIKAVLVELVPRWRFVGVEKKAESEGGEAKGPAGAEAEAELLKDGEEQLGRGVRPAHPSLTFRPAGGLRVRFERV
ncbi:cytochrome P450 [Biscogniauxia sp. FL1348]|nr:cytochrome P450 [Biscogniauxia sp. FL1348]